MAITKKTRFEVFKRDSFTCQYCGRSAPDIVLNVDHLHPRSKGGSNDILNLVTSCYDCNQGKKDRELSDTSVIQKRKAQLETLQERREQLDMMMEWQRGLTDIEGETVKQLSDFWTELSGYRLNEFGLGGFRKLARKFSIPEIAEAIRTAFDQYCEIGEDGLVTKESADFACAKIGAIIVVTRRCKEKPYLKDLYYIRGILRKRLNYVNERMVMPVLESAVLSGVDPDDIKQVACSVGTWTGFCSQIDELEGEM